MEARADVECLPKRHSGIPFGNGATNGTVAGSSCNVNDTRGENVTCTEKEICTKGGKRVYTDILDRSFDSLMDEDISNPPSPVLVNMKAPTSAICSVSKKCEPSPLKSVTTPNGEVGGENGCKKRPDTPMPSPQRFYSHPDETEDPRPDTLPLAGHPDEKVNPHPATPPLANDGDTDDDVVEVVYVHEDPLPAVSFV